MTRLSATVMLGLTMMVWVLAVVHADSHTSGPPPQTDCPQLGKEKEHGMCERDEQPVESGEGAQCIEMPPLHCPQSEHWMQEGSVCFFPSIHPRQAFTCKAGKWTSTDAWALRGHRHKRFVGFVVGIFAAAVVGCMVFCDSGGSSYRPPPNKPPRISCPGDVHVTALAGQHEAQATWNLPSAYDPDGRYPSVRRRSGPGPGSTFPEGRTFISYEATDTGGLTDSCSFTVQVTVVRCLPRAQTPVNGQRPVCSGAQEENQYGAQCLFSCNHGYKLEGQSSMACQENGQWSNDPPECLPVKCGDPGEVANGAVQCLTGHSFPAWCSVHCHSGYTTTTVITTCAAQGLWTPPVGQLQCEDTEAPTFPHGCPPDLHEFSGPLGSPVTLTWDDPETLDNSGENVTLTSSKKSGSSFPPGLHTVKVTATDFAGNSQSCRFFILVNERQCPSLSITNGHVTCDHGNLEGSECTVTCLRGYLIQGPASMTCKANGGWTLVPTCQEITCPVQPPAVEGGNLRCLGKPKFDSSCYLECNLGYSSIPPVFATCGLDGNWSQPGGCQDVEPPTIDCPENIEVSASPLGQPTIVTWPYPTMMDNSPHKVTITSDVKRESEFLTGVTPVTYTASDSSGNSGTCRFSVSVTALTCNPPNLTELADSSFLMESQCPQNHVYGAQCTLSCTSGYSLSGANTITCEQNDDVSNTPPLSWQYNGMKPACDHNCSELKAPQNGAMSCVLGNVGPECYMSCHKDWDIPRRFDGRYFCSNFEGVWRPSSDVPDCIEAHLPGRVKFLSQFYYYSDTCNKSLQEIRKKFITALNSSHWKKICDNKQACRVENVQVTCGPSLGRRKRRAVDLKRNGQSGRREEAESGRRRRQASMGVAFKVSFDMVMDYQQNGTDENTFAGYKAKEIQIWRSLRTDAENGLFSLGSLTPVVRYIKYPTVTFDGCPEGTKFTYRHYNAKATCVGCYRGHYLEGEECVECPQGQYTALDNATACTPCPPGFSTLTNASISRHQCKEVCPPGFFSPSGFAPCQPCPSGQYQSRDQSVTCDLCPVGTWTELAGAVSKSDCAAADVKLLPNLTVSASLSVTPDSTLTLMTWLKLQPNSSVSLEIQIPINRRKVFLDSKLLFFNDDLDLTIQHQAEYHMFRAPVGKWTRFLMVVTGSLNGGLVNFYCDSDPLLYTIWLSRLVIRNPIRSPLSVHLTATGQQGNVLLSGPHAELRAWSKEEIKAPSASCLQSFYHNIITWSPPPSTLHVPSSCDAVDECQSLPCGDEGVCEDRVGHFLCHCQRGWTGETCQVPPDPCSDHRCQNSGRCVPAGHYNYTCDCLEDFSGSFCQLERVHGEWGEWEEWSQCSQTCEGLHQRQRHCDNPEPANGGSGCTGPNYQAGICGERLCPVDGGWSSWGTWSTCSATCGGGERTRSRRCDNPAPQNGGGNCTGGYRETQTCADTVCPVHGGWGNWSEWTSCSVTCGEGVQSRERSCDSPVPANQGQPCQGTANQTRPCNLTACPECSELPEVEGTGFNCSEEASPYLKTCRVSCSRGYGTPSPAVYTCGQATGHLWNFERQNTSLAREAIQYCTPLATPTKASLTNSVALPVAGCGQEGQISSQVMHSLHRLPCRQQEKCQISVQTLCDDSASASSSSAVANVMVNLTADLGEGIVLSGDADPSLDEFIDTLLVLDQSAVMMVLNDTQSLFTVTLDDVTIVPDVNASSYAAGLGCPPGASLSTDGGCMDCPAGFHEVQGQCVVCPLGQFQDQPASTFCKPCPPGTSWDSPGASDSSQCLDTRSEEEEEEKEEKQQQQQEQEEEEEKEKEERPTKPEDGISATVILTVSISCTLLVAVAVMAWIIVHLRRTGIWTPKQHSPRAVPASRAFENEMYSNST